MKELRGAPPHRVVDRPAGAATVFDAEGAGPAPIAITKIDPALAQLGLLLGILTAGSPQNGEPTYDVNPMWFADPVGNLRTAVTSNGQNLAQLLGQLLGSAGGQALGVPVKDPAIAGTWYPITVPGETTPTGLYLTSTPVDGNGTPVPAASATAELFGLGVLHRWELPAASPDVTVEVFAVLPLVQVGGGTFEQALTRSPITLGIAVEGVAGKPLIDLDPPGLSFQGVKASVEIVLGGPSVQASVVVLQLQLPGETAQDRSLADLAHSSADQIRAAASALFVGALAKVSAEMADHAPYILPMLGLLATVPGETTALPLLDWAGLFEAAANPVAPFQAWFRALASDPAAMTAWLVAVVGAMRGSAAANPANVTGTGTRDDPVAVPILNPTAGVLSFTMASVVTPDGRRHLYPGLAFAATPIALGSSTKVLTMAAEAELAEFVISDSAESAGASLRMSAGLALTDKDPTKPLASETVGGDTYSFGALRAGVALGANLAPLPQVTLTDVQTPQGNHAAIDLLSPSAVATVAEQALAGILETQLEKLLGLKTAPSAFASHAAALIGVVAPGGGTVTWPLTPPFSSPTAIVASITDPVGALAGYYQAALTAAPIGGQAAFAYLLAELAGLVGDAGATAVTGQGTPDAPWQAPIHQTSDGLLASLTAYSPPPAVGDTVTRLVIGVELQPTLMLGGTKVVPSVSLALLEIDLPNPNTGASLSATWAPMLGAQISLPDGFTSPSIGGAVVTIPTVALSAAWSRTGGWDFSALAAAPVLTIGTQTFPLGQDFDFADVAALEKLVTGEVPAFVDALAALLGVALLRSGSRAGLALAGLFGLLQNIAAAPAFPPGLTWPATTPLALKGFADPWPELRAQLAADFASAEVGPAVLTLIGWALDGTLTTAPTIAGNGKPATPFAVPLGSVPFDLLVSYAGDTAQTLGLGLGRSATTVLGTVSATSSARLDALQVLLSTGAVGTGAGAPALTVQTTLTGKTGSLLPGVLDSIELGVALSFVGGAPVATPVVTLSNVTLPGDAQPRPALTLADFQGIDFTDRLRQGFLSVVNTAIATLPADAAHAFPALGTTYDLLADLGLALPRTQPTDPYAINPDGWTALLADPTGFLKTQLTTLLQDAGKRTAFFSFVAAQLGLTLPTVPPGALILLGALGLVGPKELGYPLRPDALLELASNPLGTVSTAFRTLAADPAALTALASALAKQVPVDTGPFAFSVTGGSVVALSLPRDKALNVGGALRLWGTLTCDLSTPSVGLEIHAFVPELGIDAVSTLKFRPKTDTTPSYGLELVWGDGSRPAPDPLTLYPFDGSAFLEELAGLAPVYVLSTLATAAFESKLLAPYPLVQKAFEGLGLAEQVDGTWTMPALLGLLKDPGAWLMSVFGTNGRFDIAKFAAWLSGLPAATSTSGVAVTPQPGTGVTIAGLPYGFSIALAGDTTTDVATIALSAGPVKVAAGGTLDELKVAISLGPTYQPGISGSVKASSDTFTVSTGYDRGFSLAVGQKAGSPPLVFQLVPFQGWTSLATEALQAAPAALLNTLLPKLLDALANAGPEAADLVARLRAAAGPTELNTADLVDRLGKVSPLTAAGVEDAALAWLRDRLSPANAPGTALAIATLFGAVLPNQVTAKGGLVSYTPSVALPVTVLVGLEETGTLTGLWLELALPEAGALHVTISRTGVGFPLAAGLTTPVFSFGAALTVPVEGTTGPRLSLTTQDGFELMFDPLGSTATGAMPSKLAVELAPKFFSAPPDLAKAVEDWLLGVVTNVLPRYVAAVILEEPNVLKWLNTGLFATVGSPTPADILVAAQLVQKNGPGYVLADIAALEALSPTTFLANLLKALLQMQVTLVTFKTGGQLAIGPKPKDPNKPADPDAFGVVLTAPNFPVPDLAHVVMQLGADDTAWIAGTGGSVGALPPGLSIYVPIAGSGNSVTPQFDKLQINLINVGVDFVGADGAPLLDFTRFQLGSVSPRAVLELALGASPTFGVAVGLDGIALSLTPNALPSSGKGNPVAQNLLGSGGAATSNPPANPSFTVQAAYFENESLWVQLSSPNGVANPTIFPVQRTFGPLHVNSLGVGTQTGPPFLLDVLFDGSVALAGLDADLTGLQVGIPVKQITDLGAYTLDLQGLSISFKGGAVSISGAFIKVDGKDGAAPSYTGAALVQAANFGLTAIGSYTVMAAPTDKDPHATAPSMFIFGALNAPLGGVPAFFVTGVAAGFGYNRSLQLPAVGDVQNFPLVSGIVDKTFTPSTGPEDAMATLGSVLAPMVGEYWIAAGIEFNSFQLVNGIALLFIAFGKTVEIDLLGLAWAALPKGVSKDNALAYVELALKATIKPEAGIVSIEAQLTPNSYVITKDCKLTGGFAFVMWLKDITIDNEHVSAGDFVISLGGYHPAFIKPKHYPDVPRLGFSWTIDASPGTVSISGGAYFALVPTAVMAGGYLSVVFTAGPLRAWLDASADFLIEWAPFYFVVDISVSIGVSFGTTILGVSVTLSVELGADLMLQGPPTHGHAHVSWYVISFTVPFGSGDDPGQNTLGWNDFAQQFLPPDTSAAQTRQAHAPHALSVVPNRSTATPAPAPPPGQPLKMSVQSGRIGGPNDPGTKTEDAWVLRPVPFALRIDTTIPISTVTIAGPAGTTPPAGPTGVVAAGVRPMAVTALDAPMTVTVTDSTGATVDLSPLTITAVTSGAPAAAWSTQALSHDTPPPTDGMVLAGSLMGVVLDASHYRLYDTVAAFAIELLAYDYNAPIRLPFAIVPVWGPATRFTAAEQAHALSRLMTTIMATTPANVVAQRNAAFAALRAAGIAAPADPSLTVMAAAANLIVQSPPVLARPAVFQAPLPVVGHIVANAAPVAAAPAPPRAPRAPQLVAMLTSYRSAKQAPPPAVAGLPPHAGSVVSRFVDVADGVVPRTQLEAAANSDRLAIHAGAVGIWEIDPAVRHSVAASGAAAVRIACFDAAGEAIADLHDAPRAKPLPAGTSTVAIFGTAPVGSTVGWQSDSSLVRINRYYAAGESCLVRIQNVQRPRKNGLTVTRGQVSGRRLLEHNLVGLEGDLRPGWIETVMPGGRRSFAVAVERLGGGARPALHVTAAVGAQPAIGRDPLEPQVVIDRAGVTVAVFSAPAAGPDEVLTVIVQPHDASTRIAGIYGSGLAPDAFAAAWDGLRLDRSAVDPAAAAHALVTLHPAAKAAVA